MKVLPISIISAVFLAGCGGSSTVVRVTNDPVVPEVLPQAAANRALRNAGPVQTDAVLLGTIEVLTRTGTTNVFETSSTETGVFTGTYNYETQQFVVTSQGQTLVAGFGDQAFQGRDTSGYRSVAVLDSFLDIPAGETNSSDFRITAAAIAGNPTRQEDMATSGTATMRGDGVLNLETDASFVGFRSDALLEIDFADGFADLTVTAESDADPEDIANEVRIENMVIDGTGFSGGSLFLNKNGEAVDLSGGVQSLDAQGQFFGRNASGPDEAGGFFEASVSDVEVSGQFLVD